MKNRDMPAMPLDVKQAEYLYKHIDQNSWAPIGLGLTKREHFAAMAMQGFCAFHGDGQNFDVTARESVDIADALLSALEKTE